MSARTSTRAQHARHLVQPRRPALTALLVAATISAAALSGCTDEDPSAAPAGETTTPSSETTSPSATPDPSATETDTAPPDTAVPDDSSTADAPPFPADTSPDTADPSMDAMLTVTDVRIGRHDGFDRVVYEMGGTGTPGWTVQYVEQAVQDGSGSVIDLAGDGTLQVQISGSAYPMDSGAEPFESAGPVTGAGTVSVTEARGWSVFEGITDAFIGLDSPGHPFRVYLMESPVRVVVDVADQTS